MGEKITINASNVNINKGNTNGGLICIGNNNTNNIVFHAKKKKSRAPKVLCDEVTKTTIFLSYTHADKKIADVVEMQLLKSGYDVKRDIRDIEPWDDLDEFMKSIRKQDYVVLLISDQYLHKENCIYEVYQLLKDDNYAQRTFPIVIPFTEQEQYECEKNNKSTFMFETEYRIEVLRFWSDYLRRLDEKLVDIPREFTAELNKKYRNIGNMVQSLMVLFEDIFDKKCLGMIEREYAKEDSMKLTKKIEEKIDKTF